jgi:hypothetical protein
MTNKTTKKLFEAAYKSCMECGDIDNIKDDFASRGIKEYYSYQTMNFLDEAFLLPNELEDRELILNWREKCSDCSFKVPLVGMELKNIHGFQEYFDSGGFKKIKLAKS